VVQSKPDEFELIGGETGDTSVTIWFQDGEMLRYLVRVSPDELEDRRRIEYKKLEQKLNEFFPESLIQLIPIADKLIVRGQARDVEEAAQIMAVVRGEGPDTDTDTVQLTEGVAADPTPGGVELPPANVINLLRVPGEQQVMLRVRVAEISRTALRQMGAELDVNVGDFIFNSFLGLDLPVRAVLDTTDVELALEALASNSYGKVLAEPNLVTLSGRPASFIAGGEFAVPTVVGVQGAAAVATNFRGFGVQLAFTPTVLDKDLIRLQVTPSLSDINQDNEVNGIPGLDTRAVTTTVDLREGQWLAIAGLLEDRQGGSKVRVPYVGDIPLLDMFFSRKEVRREETELVILVSPELVHPLDPCEMPPILPGMEVTEPSNNCFYFWGNIEGDPNRHFRSTVHPNCVRNNGFAVREAMREARRARAAGYYMHGRRGFSN
jgi:pilus assembly protein CpaC